MTMRTARGHGSRRRWLTSRRLHGERRRIARSLERGDQSPARETSRATPGPAEPGGPGQRPDAPRTGPVLRPAPERSRPAAVHRTAAACVRAARALDPRTLGAARRCDARPRARRPARDARGGRGRRAAMHAANRAAWDEAAERYEGWFDEAVELIRGGGSNLLPVELDLIGDLRGRCRRAIHLQCAGGRDTLSLWNLGADEVVGVDFSPRMLDLAARLAAATGAPARWVEADVLDTPHDLDGTGDLVYTGRGAILWLQDLDAWAAVLRRLLAPGGAPRDLRRPPGRVAVRRRRGRRWRLTDYDYFGGAEASRGWAPEYIDRLSIPDGRAALEVRPRRGRWARSSPRCSARACASSASRSTRSTGGPATATSAPRSAAGSPSRSRSRRPGRGDGQ